MGCFLSTTTATATTHRTFPPPPQPSPSSSMSNAQLNPDLTSYHHACQSDTHLQSFDSTLQHRTTNLINSLAVGVEIHSLSLNSLREVTGSLLDMNQEVVRVILECKKDIWDNDQLFSLVKDYFEISLQTLDFCTSLQNCLKTARSSLSFLQIAINQYDADANRIPIIEQLKQFKGLALDSPFSDEFFELFQSLYQKQVTMLKKMQTQKGKIDKKLKSTKTWRRLSNVIFVTAFSTVLICSVVAAAVAAPPLVTALAAAMAVPLGPMGKWINSLWKKYENEVKDQKGVIGAMQIRNYIVVKELDNIKTLVEKLGIEMEGVLQNAEFAIEEEDVEVVMDEIKKSVDMFGKTIDDLSDHSEKCMSDTGRARTMILQRISKHPSDSL